MTATIAPDRPARTRALPVLLSVRLSTGTYERVEALAARNGVGAALVCRQLIEAALRVEALG